MALCRSASPTCPPRLPPRLLLTALLALAACRSGRTRPEILSPSAVVLETPLVEQDELYECGLVAISALCGYYRIEIPTAERVELVRTAAERKGLSGAELREALERRGLEVFLFQGALDRGPTGLLHHVDQGRPLIVMTSEGGESHYCLFIGYDAELGSVVLLDPRRGRVVLPTGVFAGLWEVGQRLTLLGVPQRKQP